MRWQHELTSDVENVAARGVTILPGGDVIVLGTFAGEIRLPGKMLVSHGSIDGFAIRLRAEDGEPVWASRFGGPGQDSIGVSAMNVDGTTWFVGSFSGSAEIGGTTIHSAMRSRDAYVAQVSADGEIRVVVRLSGPRHTEGISSVFHTAVGTYLVGYFSLEMWIGDIKLKAAPPLGANGFVAFADRAGTVVWAKMIPWIRSAGAAAAAASEGGLWILSNGDSMDIDKSMTMQLSHFSPTGERSFSADVGTGSPRAVAQVGSRIVFGSVIYLEGRRTFHLTFATLE
jgi:outer membrane protein assembly factor BamB